MSFEWVNICWNECLSEIYIEREGESVRLCERGKFIIIIPIFFFFLYFYFIFFQSEREHKWGNLPLYLLSSLFFISFSPSSSSSLKILPLTQPLGQSGYFLHPFFSFFLSPWLFPASWPTKIVVSEMYQRVELLY